MGVAHEGLLALSVGVRAGAAAQLEELVAAGSVTREPLGDDALWRAA